MNISKLRIKIAHFGLLPAIESTYLNYICGTDKYLVEVLWNPNRSFLNRLTDIILLDPIGRCLGNIPANKLNKSRENRVNIGQDGAMDKHNLRAAETSISYRKVTSPLVWAGFIASYLMVSNIASTVALSGKTVALSSVVMCTTFASFMSTMVIMAILMKFISTEISAFRNAEQRVRL